MKHMKRFLAAALCAAAAVCTLAALAAEPKEEKKPEAESPQPPAPGYEVPLRVWGTLTKEDGGGLRLRNGDEDDPYHEVILHLEEGAAIVDAVTGLPMDEAELSDGDTMAAWIGPAVGMSLPPYATTAVAVANLPADGASPAYYEVAQVGEKTYDGRSESARLSKVELLTTSGETVAVTNQAELTPWLTRQIVALEDLVPGARFLAWTGARGAVSRVVLFPYAYRDYLSVDTAGGILNENIGQDGKVMDGVVMLPLRAVAESVGLEAAWSAGKGAVVSADGVELFSVLPGAQEVRMPDGPRGLEAPCVLEDGVTYLPAGDLAELLNLFLCPPLKA